MFRLAKGLGLRDCKQLVYGRAWQVWQCRWMELTKGRVAWEFWADGGFVPWADYEGVLHINGARLYECASGVVQLRIGITFF